jgi:DNA polymerase-1
MPRAHAQAERAQPSAIAGKRVFLIDGTAFCYRAFYAIRNLSTSTGQPTNAVYGFGVMMGALRQKHQPDYLAVAFDAGKPTFRHAKFADYKVQRPPMPDGLVSQLGLIQRLLDGYRVPTFKLEGFEAEDLLATVARRVAGEGVTVFLVTGDKDALQLIGPHVKVFNPHKDEGILIDAPQVVERYGIGPDRVVDLMALMGDDIDNIPGVPGVGERTAADLLRRFGTLEALYQRLDEVPSPALRTKLAAHRDQVAMSRELATIHAEAPIEVRLDALSVQEPDWTALRALFRELEFRKLVAEADAALPAAAPPTVTVRLVQTPEEVARLVVTLNAGTASGADAARAASIAAWTAPAPKPAAADQTNGQATWTMDAAAPRAVLAISTAEGEAWLVAGDATAPVWAPLRGWLADAARPKLGHDLKTTMLTLSRLGLPLAGVAGDTMIAGALLDPAHADPSLADLAEQHLERRVPAVEWDGATLDGPLGQALGAHVATVAPLHAALLTKLQQAQLDTLYRDLELPLISVLAEMEAAGVALDTSLLASMRTTMAAKLEQLTQELYQLAGGPFNANSPKQLADILFTRLQLPVGKRTKTGPSTDSDVLRQLADKHPFPKKLMEFRELSKLVSTYVDALPKLVRPDTGRLHTTFHQTGAATGRLSSSDPNLQNIPLKTDLGRQIRKAFVPGPRGWILIAADYSQIELRLLAHMAGDETLREAFARGHDIHRFTASLVYGVAYDDVTREMRSAMKAVNFGILYGMSAHGLSRELGVPQKEAAAFIEAYFARYPKVRAFLDSQKELAKSQGFVQTLLGRRRYIPELRSPDPNIRQFGERMAINAPLQGTAADIIKLAMVRCAPRLRAAGLDTRMLLQVHDELVFEAPPSEQARLIPLIRDAMEHVVNLSVPLEVTVKAGPNWCELSPVESA